MPPDRSRPRPQGHPRGAVQLLHEVPAAPDPRRHRAPARRSVHPGRGQRDARGQRGVQEGLQGARQPGEGEGACQVTHGRKLEAPHRRLESTPPRIVERAAVIGYRSAATVLAHVPPSLSRAVIATASQASYLAWPAKRRFSNANFAKVLGLPPGHPRVRRLALRAYKEYARYMVELMRLPSRRREELVDGVERLAAAWRDSGQAMSVVAGHVGNNEAVAAAIAGAGYPANVIADDSSV